MSKQKSFAIIPAAGSGSRMHAKLPKQYLTLQGKPILAHTLSRLSEVSLFEKMVLVLSEHDTRGALVAHPYEQVMIAPGGERRVDSVRNGLRALAHLASPDDWIWVHDAARPMVTTAHLHALNEALADEPVGAILGVPVRDTLKKCDKKGTILHTVDREQLWAAQTPQVFRYHLLVQALSDERMTFTDEASAIERLGLPVQMVLGSAVNIKITYPEDLQWAECWMKEEASCE